MNLKTAPYILWRRRVLLLLCSAARPAATDAPMQQQCTNVHPCSILQTPNWMFMYMILFDKCRSFNFTGNYPSGHRICYSTAQCSASRSLQVGWRRWQRRQQAFPLGHLVQGYRGECFRVPSWPPELAVRNHAQLDQFAVVAQPGFLPLERSYGLLIDVAPVQEQADLFVAAALGTRTEASVWISRN
jgi:hypothetical protein